MLGDDRAARSSLTEAVTLFDAALGSSHPRTRAAAAVLKGLADR
jgi:hypothetical protein